MGSSIQATPLSQCSATLLARLPTELNLHILSYCQRNDLICLSLTSHYFRDLVLPMIPKRLSLELYDQNIASQDLRCGCGEKLPTAVERDPRAHRRRQHHFRFEHSTCPHYYIDCRAYPEGHAACKIRGCHHCECISCPLHTRLCTWIGGDLRYCNECRRFTKRETTKKYKGRCKCRFTQVMGFLRTNVKADSSLPGLHGRAKVRRSPNNHWTAVKGQSYGPRWWRRWGTSGVDSWGFDDDKHKRDDPTTWARRRNPRVV